MNVHVTGKHVIMYMLITADKSMDNMLIISGAVKYVLR